MSKTFRTRLALACVLVAACATNNVVNAQSVADPMPGFPLVSATNDWPWWRGPTRDGHSAAGAKPPTTFGDDGAGGLVNVVWKVPVPGRGHASPVVVGTRIFLTTADETKQTQSAVAFDRVNGRQLWQREISAGGFPQMHRNNTHASPTVACDGERIFVVFHHHDTLQCVALDFDGKPVWNESLGEYHPTAFEFGYGASPVVFGDTLIIAAEYDGDSHITALDRRTGKAVWRTPRPNNTTFSSPQINIIGGKPLLTITGADKLWCFDPNSGRDLWSVPGTTAATCGTTVTDGDIIFASGGYPKSETIAVRATGNGEVLWTNKQKCYEQSMLAIGGYLYALTDNGVLYCCRGSDGEEMWSKRLRGPVSSSPVHANGHIYWGNERGTHYVFKATGEALELVAENQLGDDSFASPAVCGDRMYYRASIGHGAERQEYLYCIGTK